MNHPLPYKAIIFDLGGVLVELTGVPRMMELTGYRFTITQLWQQWITSPVIRAFESGAMTIDEFGRRIVAEFSINLPPEQYLAEFTLWPAGPFPGVTELLLELKDEIIIASLSNTNNLHWGRVVNNMGFIHHFHYNFPSHLTGHLKPDLETYSFVATSMQIPPQDILFLDDNQLNVEGAKRAGIQAAEVHGIEDIRKLLVKKRHPEANNE